MYKHNTGCYVPFDIWMSHRLVLSSLTKKQTKNIRLKMGQV